jgi:potassium/hydrogen antiporter
LPCLAVAFSPDGSGVAVSDVVRFGVIIVVISVAGLLAVWSNRFTERVRVPAPAIFLVAAAVISDLVPALGRVPVVTVERVVTVMLILLLFDGGMHIGWRFRPSTAAPPGRTNRRSARSATP